MSITTSNIENQCNWVPQIDLKIDPKQLTFNIPHEILPLARKIFKKRYFCDIAAEPDYTVQWSDITKSNRRLTIKDDDNLNVIPTTLPSDCLFKSKIQVNCGPHKLITITIFYTTGTVLVQGNLCRKWMRNEFESLIRVIRIIYSLANHTHTPPALGAAVHDSLSSLPLPHLKKLPKGNAVQDIPSSSGCLFFPSLQFLISPTATPQPSPNVHRDPTFQVMASSPNQSEPQTILPPSQQPDPAVDNLSEPHTILPPSQQKDHAVDTSQQPDPAVDNLSEPHTILPPPQQPDPAVDNLSEPHTILTHSQQPDPAVDTSQQPDPAVDSLSEPHTILPTPQEPDPAVDNLSEPQTIPPPSQQPDPTIDNQSEPQTILPPSQQPDPEVDTNSSLTMLCPSQQLDFSCHTPLTSVQQLDDQPAELVGTHKHSTASHTVHPPATKSKPTQHSKLRPKQKKTKKTTNKFLRSHNCKTTQTLRHLKQKVSTLVNTIKKASEVVMVVYHTVHRLQEENNSLKSELTNLKHKVTMSVPVQPTTTTSLQQPGSILNAFPTKNRFSLLLDPNELKKQNSQSDSEKGSTGTNPNTSQSASKEHNKDSKSIEHQDTDSQISDTNGWTTVFHKKKNTKTTGRTPHVDSVDPNSQHQNSNNSTTLTARQHLAKLRAEPTTSNLIIGDYVTQRLKPDILFSGGRSQNISVPGLTVDDLIHWLKHIPHNANVQHIIFHVGINTCKHTSITTNTWTQLIRNIKRVFPQAKLLASSIIPPMGQHLLKKTVHLSNLSLAKVCANENIVCADHTHLFTAKSGAPRKDMYADPLHPSPNGTNRFTYNLKYADPKRRPLLKTPNPQQGDGNGHYSLPTPSSLPKKMIPTFHPFHHPSPGARFQSTQQLSGPQPTHHVHYSNAWVTSRDYRPLPTEVAKPWPPHIPPPYPAVPSIRRQPLPQRLYVIETQV